MASFVQAAQNACAAADDSWLCADYVSGKEAICLWPQRPETSQHANVTSPKKRPKNARVAVATRNRSRAHGCAVRRSSGSRWRRVDRGTRYRCTTRCIYVWVDYTSPVGAVPRARPSPTARRRAPSIVAVPIVGLRACWPVATGELMEQNHVGLVPVDLVELEGGLRAE